MDYATQVKEEREELEKEGYMGEKVKWRGRC